jgi:hypothetical protein
MVKGISKLITLDDDVTVSVKQFDLSNMKPNPSILIIGKRRSGKTTDCVNIINALFRVDMIYNSSGYIVGKSDSLIKFMKNFGSINGAEKLITGDVVKNLDNAETDYLVMDDCITYKTHNIVETVAKNSKKTRIMTMQYPLYTAPNIVNKIDYIFIHNTEFYTARKKIYNMYINNKQFIANFRAFEKVFDQVTEGYDCMVINNTSNSNKLVDRVFFYNSMKNYATSNAVNSMIEKARNCDDSFIVITHATEGINIVEDYFEDTNIRTEEIEAPVEPVEPVIPEEQTVPVPDSHYQCLIL